MSRVLYCYPPLGQTGHPRFQADRDLCDPERRATPRVHWRRARHADAVATNGVFAAAGDLHARDRCYSVRPRRPAPSVLCLGPLPLHSTGWRPGEPLGSFRSPSSPETLAPTRRPASARLTLSLARVRGRAFRSCGSRQAAARAKRAFLNQLRSERRRASGFGSRYNLSQAESSHMSEQCSPRSRQPHIEPLLPANLVGVLFLFYLIVPCLGSSAVKPRPPRRRRVEIRISPSADTGMSLSKTCKRSLRIERRFSRG
jgi:hypothetical protein